MKEYVVFDLETSGLNSKYAEIIEISALKVNNGSVVDTFSTLVKPSKSIDFKSSSINGITDEMVSNAPTLSDVLPSFMSFIGNNILVGHNISTFDMPILRRVAHDCIGYTVENDCIDTLHLARKVISVLPDYSLSTIAAYFTLDTSGSHRALKDCEITYKCFEKLTEIAPDISIKKKESHKYHTQYTEQTKSLQTLHGFLQGVIADNILTESEVLALRAWLNDNISLRGQYPFDRVYDVIEAALDDGILEQKELEDMFLLFQKYIDPIKNTTTDSSTITIQDKLFCLTGDFTHGTRKEVETFISSKGGICKSGVSSKTNYVVVGSNGSPDWACGNYGSKIKKALELQENGNPIQILKETDFFDKL